MPSPRPLFALALLAAVCLVGCGNPSAKLLGKWKMSGIGEAEGNPLAGMMAQMMKIGFEFKADGSCISSIEALGQQQSATGTWRFVKSEGSDLVIALKMPPANKEGEVRISFQDNDHCSFVPPEGLDKGGGKSPGKLEFVREK
jgi:hypothetical protein